MTSGVASQTEFLPRPPAAEGEDGTRGRRATAGGAGRNRALRTRTLSAAEDTREGAPPYQYDAHDRLSDVSLDGNPVESFDYDGNGNRTGYWSPSTGNVTATYDDQDRMLSYGDWQYDYGANGELRSKLHVPSGDETVYTYDVLGNLLSVSLPSGSLIEYLVDGMGRRVGKKVDGVLVKQWLYRDSLKPAAELDGAGVLQKQFIYVAGKTAPDLIIAGGVTYRVLSDQLGSPRLVVDAATGSVVARMRHDAFGNVLEDTNPGFLPFGFAGGLYDADTGLVRFGARDYDAVTGRWTAKDPIRFDATGTNLYSYALNDPINVADRDGRNPLVVVAVCVGGGCGAAAAAAAATAAAIWCVVSGACDAAADAIQEMCRPDDPPPPPPREICNLVNETQNSCIYVCLPSKTLRVTDRTLSPPLESGGILYPPANDVCPQTVSG